MLVAILKLFCKILLGKPCWSWLNQAPLLTHISEFASRSILLFGDWSKISEATADTPTSPVGAPTGSTAVHATTSALLVAVSATASTAAAIATIISEAAVAGAISRPQPRPQAGGETRS